MVLIGRRIRDYFRKTGQDFLADYVNLGDYPDIHQAREIASLVQEFYLNGLFDHVAVLYTRFVSTVNSQVTVEQILPIEASIETKPEKSMNPLKTGPKALYLFEPSIPAVLDAMVPLYITTVIFQSLLEATTSQQGLP